MDKTIGQTGIVKSVDHHNSLVLIQFYNPELATLNEWWYPIRVLEKCEQPQVSPVASVANDNLQSKFSECNFELTHIYARQTIQSLLHHCSATLSDGPVLVKDILNLFCMEPISTPLLTLSGENGSTLSHLSPNLNVLKTRLLAVYETGVKGDDLTQLLVKECLRIFSNNSKLASKPGLTVISAKPPAVNAQQVKVDGARSLIIMFDRPLTFIPANSQGTLCFYLDEACTNQIACYTEKSKWSPLIVPGNEVWVKFICSSATHRNNAKYRFSASPGMK